MRKPSPKKSTTSNADKKLPRKWHLYRSSQPSSTKPAEVDEDVAFDLIGQNMATRNGRYSIRLTKQGEAKFIKIKLSDLSCKPGQWLLDANAEGKDFAVAITIAWEPKIRFAY